MKRSSFLVVSSILVLAGCANVIDKPFQHVTLTTPGVAGADCYLETSDNRYSIVTPGATRIERSSENLKVTCHKAGYYDKVVEIESRLRGTTFLNIFNGIIPGTAYDAASHSIYGYPDQIDVVMEKMPAPAADEAEAPAAPLARKNVQEPVPGMMPSPEQKSQVDNSLSKSLRK